MKLTYFSTIIVSNRWKSIWQYYCLVLYYQPSNSCLLFVLLFHVFFFGSFIQVSLLVFPCPVSILYCPVLFCTTLPCIYIVLSYSVLPLSFTMLSSWYILYLILYLTLLYSLLSTYSLRSVACSSHNGCLALIGCTQSYHQVRIIIFTLQFFFSLDLLCRMAQCSIEWFGASDCVV